MLYQELQVLVDASEFDQLARFRFISAGGNGATFEWDLGVFSKYAVKLVSIYNVMYMYTGSIVIRSTCLQMKN